MANAEGQQSRDTDVHDSRTEQTSAASADAHLDFTMKRKTVRISMARHRKIQGAVFPAGVQGNADVARVGVWKLYQQLVAEREQRLRSKARLASKEDTAMTRGEETVVAKRWMNATTRFLTQMEEAIEKAGLRHESCNAQVGQVVKESAKNDDPTTQGRVVPEELVRKEKKRLAFLRWRHRWRQGKRLARLKRVIKREARRVFPSYGSNISSVVRKHGVRSKPTIAAAAKGPRRPTAFSRRWKSLPELRPGAIPIGPKPGVLLSLTKLDMRPRRRRRGAQVTWHTHHDRVLCGGKERVHAGHPYSVKAADCASRRPLRRIRFVKSTIPARVRRYRFSNQEVRVAWKTGKQAWDELLGDEGVAGDGPGARDVAETREGDGEDDKVRKRQKEEVLKGVKGLVGVGELDRSGDES